MSLKYCSLSWQAFTTCTSHAMSTEKQEVSVCFLLNAVRFTFLVVQVPPFFDHHLRRKPLEYCAAHYSKVFCRVHSRVVFYSARAEQPFWT